MAHAEPEFERVLEYLRLNRGFDFTAYKPASLMRRVLKRMQAVHIERFDQYLDYLQVHPNEFAALFNTILINVTSFFRDPEVWEVLRTRVLPESPVVQGGGPIRVWSAGCASGQEAYSAAMLLAELIGVDAVTNRVKIYATDVDDDALSDARRAVYTEKQIADVPPPLREKYFTNSNGELYAFDRDLRRSVIFGRHDLIQDAPISRIDLLLCRNTLMYFNAETQGRILARFYFSANAGGHLLLGRAEMLSSHAAMFTPVDLKRRIFQTAPKLNHRDRLLALAHAGREDAAPQIPDHLRLREAAFESGSDAQIVLDPAGAVVAVNAVARRLFGVDDADVGSPLQNLALADPPAELRPAIERARDERRDVTLRSVPWEHNGTTRFLDVAIAALQDHADDTVLGTRVSFTDVTPIKSLQDELARSKQELETAYEELQSTNEELESTNEELQSTVEELETTNEELQSTNEELETMNEELQSTNEELQTMNDELRTRSGELNSSNAFLEAVFTSLRAAVVVVDRDLRVQVWNLGALDMWGLRPDEAQGASFFSLDVGLPVAELQQPIREILSGSVSQREGVVAATNRKGRSIRCRVSVAPLLSHDRAISGAILLMQDDGAPVQP